MSKLLLLIHNEEDISNLEIAAQQIVDHGFEGVWILHSPAIAADQATVAVKFDKDIADLDAQVKLCGQREDGVGMEAAKLARDGKKMERSMALLNAWKSVPEADRPSIYAAKTDPLRRAFQKYGIHARVNVTSDHYDASQAFQMLVSMGPIWFSVFVHGKYMIGWPGAFPEIRNHGAKIPIVQELAATSNTAKFVPVNVDAAMNPGTFPRGAGNAIQAPVTPPAKKKPEKRQPEPKATTPDARRAQLTSMPFFSRKSLCGKLGIEVKDKNTSVLVEEILAKEFQAVA